MNKNGIWKIAIVSLVLILLIAAGFFVTELVEKPLPEESGEAEETIVIDGERYVKKNGVESLMVISLNGGENGDTVDSVMLVVFDNYSEKYAVVHIDPDTVTRIYHLAVGGRMSLGSYEGRIAAAFEDAETDSDRDRCRNIKNSLEALLRGQNINHYLLIRTASAAELNDLVGGVEVVIPEDLTYLDARFTEGARLTLTGEEALKYIQKEEAGSGFDHARAERQRQFINSFCKKVLVSIDESEEFGEADFALIEAVRRNMVYDSSEQRLKRWAERAESYEFLGIREIRAEIGPDGLIPDDDAVTEILTGLFLLPAKR
ncbi:MAG: LCP family protein [Clostridia bacterium]|nr:LCP family protein [Clostridia bacterium]